MTESPFVKAEGPELHDVADILGEKHREMMAKLDAAIINQLKQQSITYIPEHTSTSTSTTIVTDPRYGHTSYREQLQPDRVEIERVRAEVYRAELELSSLRNKLTQETDKLNHVSNSLRISVAKLIDAYQLIGQLVGFLDSIEWGTHDEWTRSQSLRERAHEYLTARNTITT